MKVFHGEADGKVENSIKYFVSFLEKNRDKFVPTKGCIERENRRYNFEIQGLLQNESKVPCVVLLSGCSCGDSGKGTHATLAVLNYLVDRNFHHNTTGQEYYLNERPELRQAIITHRHIHFDFGNLPDLVWQVVSEGGDDYLLGGDERGLPAMADDYA